MDHHHVHALCTSTLLMAQTVLGTAAAQQHLCPCGATLCSPPAHLLLTCLGILLQSSHGSRKSSRRVNSFKSGERQEIGDSVRFDAPDGGIENAFGRRKVGRIALHAAAQRQLDCMLPCGGASCNDMVPTSQAEMAFL